MLRTSLRTALAHKGRLALSALAVLLGVAFVAGTFVFTDTLSRTFSTLFEATTPDVVVTAASEDGQQAVGESTAVSSEVLEVVRHLEGVATAGGDVSVPGVTLLGSDGEPVGSMGAMSSGVSWSEDTELSPLRLVDGRGPTAADEVAVDVTALEDGGLELGDTVRVLTPGPMIEAELVGTFQYGAGSSLAGGTLTAFAPTVAQDVLLGGSGWSSIGAVGERGVSQDELAARLDAAIGAAGVGPVRVQTGEQVQDETAAEISDALGFFTTFLLVFAAVALFVGAFIIVNTFSVLIARRTRELALLRTLGASRRQVVASVLLEAALVGVLGALGGLLAGLGMAVALRELFSLLGVDIPAGGLVVEPRTVLVALAIGVGTTMVAAWLPARRAGAVAPVAALRENTAAESRSLGGRTVLGLALGAAGSALLAVGLLGEVRYALGLVGAGILLLVLAVAMLSAVIGARAVGLLGAPVTGRAVGRMAVRNTQREPRRAAATSGALMIGLSLVTAIGVLGSSATRSVETGLDEVMRADYVVRSVSWQPFSPQVGDRVARVDGVDLVSRVGLAPVRLQDDQAAGLMEANSAATQAMAVDLDTVETVLALDVVAGDLASLGSGAVAVDEQTAQARGLRLGSLLDLTWATGPRSYPVGALYSDASATLSGVVLDRSELIAGGVTPQDLTLYVTAAPDIEAADLRASLESALATYPTVAVQDQTQMMQSVRDQVDQMLGIVYALLGLALVIAVLGIVNTLLLSVLERTHEVGLLRAVGTGRNQIRSMVRIEALLTALFGAVLGVGLGLGVGVAVQQALIDDGVTELAVPWTLIGVVLVLSGLVGTVAAILPARRAASMDVLVAIASE